jgi:hypothetical protein
VGTVKRIVCLANSRKPGGRCVAGKELSPTGQSAGWIRPVGARDHGEVWLSERQYADGSDPSVLDIMDVPVVEHRPRNYQQENWLIDTTRRWAKVGEIGWGDAVALLDPVDRLWICGHHTGSGRNDKIPGELANSVDSSLRLIRVSDLALQVFTDGEAFGYPRRRVQGRFSHAGTQYWLSVTDPRYEEVYKPKPDGSYKIGECLLTISISEPFDKQQASYKLIAAIVAKGGLGI